jgi:hypothetical protein
MQTSFITVLVAGVAPLVVGLACGDQSTTSSPPSPSPSASATSMPSGGAPLPSAPLERVEALGYRRWATAPGYEQRVESQGPHGGEVDIYVNETVTEALNGAGLEEWPEGALIVKDGFNGDKQLLTAIMEKRADGWAWSEYYTGGEPYSGPPNVCINCHQSGSDFVRAFSLP